uniref:Protein-tyrosine phosphatase n=1 Tax=Toxocara canis TaxID=6265 RepID=A0A183V9Q5_TOXCA
LAGMRAFAEKTNTIGVDGLISMFAELQQRGPHPSQMTVAAQMRNRSKCRYVDIPCLDETRVILKPWPDAQGDFIHANWIIDELLDNKLICTQGPLDTTNGDFWRMVWQENVETIVMLCRVVEAGRVKCSQYWPRTVGETKSFCGIIVKNEAVRSSNPDVWCTDLTISHGDEKRKVTHYQWVTWPDRFVPKQLVVPFMMLSVVRSCKSTVIVHCSAGIGRTGTLVVLEILIRSLLFGREISVPEIVWSVRSQRSKSVQCEEQFLYIHYLIIQRFLNKGILPDRVVMNFCREYESYYYSKTHVVQVPLPVFVRRRIAYDQVDKRRMVTAKTQLVSQMNENVTKPLYNYKVMGANEKIMTPVRTTPKTFAPIATARKCSLVFAGGCGNKICFQVPLISKEPNEMVGRQKECVRGAKTDSDEVEKNLARAVEMIRELLASNKSPEEIQQEQEKVLQTLGLANQQAKCALELRLRQTSGLPNAIPVTSPTPASPVKQSVPLPGFKTGQPLSQTASQSPITAVSASPINKPATSPMNVANIAKPSEKMAKTANSSANVNEAGGDDDDDAVVSYYFMQPEWPYSTNQTNERSPKEPQPQNKNVVS